LTKPSSFIDISAGYNNNQQKPKCNLTLGQIIAFLVAIHITSHYVNYLRIETYDDIAELKSKLLDFDGDTPPTALQLGWTTIAGMCTNSAL
jgi:hypothetical protein